MENLLAHSWYLGLLRVKEALGNSSLLVSLLGTQDGILVEIVRILGRLERWWYKWEGSTRYFEENGSLVGFGDGFWGYAGGWFEGEGAAVETAEDVLDPAETRALEKMLREMLEYEAEKRIGAEEVLRLLLTKPRS